MEEVLGMSELKFEIKKNIGIFGQGQNGWNKEINLVSWNEKKPKIDIREWDENHKKMSKGITMIKDEVLKLKELLNSVDVGELC